MFLTHLHLRSAPGLPHGLQLDDLKPGLNLLFGPNASGKSTIGRTLRGSLWPDHAPAGVDARSTWQSSLDGPPLRSTTVFARTQWDDADVSLPPAELADVARLNLRDLLDATDLNIAKKVQLELDGGYDISALTLAAAPRFRPLPTVSRDYRAAQTALNKALGEADALAQQESRLAGLKAKLEQALDAHVRIADVERAIHARAQEAVVVERKAALKDLEDAHPSLTREHLDQLRSARDRMNDAARERRDVRARIEAAEHQLQRHTFPASRPSIPALANLVERARTLAQAFADLQGLEQDHAAAEQSLRVQSSQVWSSPDSARAPDQEALESLHTLIQHFLDAQAALDRHGPTPEVLAPAPSPALVQRLEEARVLLQQWLKTPQLPVVQSETTPLPGWFKLLPLVGAILVMIGLVVAMLAHAVAGTVVVALGLGLVGFWGGSRWATTQATSPEPAADSEADILARRYRGEDLPTVSSWDAETVSTALSELDLRLQNAREMQRAKQAAEQHARQRVRLTTARDEARTNRDRQIESMGLNPSLGGLSLLHQANRLQGLCNAIADEASVDARVRTKATAVNAEWTELQSQLAALNLPDLDAPEHISDLLPAARTALKRLETLESTESELTRLRRLDAQVQNREHQEKQRHAVILQDLNLDNADPEQFPLLLERANQRRAAQEALNEALLALRILRQNRPTDLPEDLDAELVRLQNLFATAEELGREVARIEERIRSVTAGGNIRGALADLDAGMEKLALDREVQWVAHAGSALKTWLQHERRSQDTPKLLQRARRWFLTFTQLRYELDVSTDGAFVANDTHTGRRQTLSELSDGTRIQLLLACRLAFLERIEGAEPTPLFLDEVLSTTDPERFSAVASAILALCQSGRQVFYATSDPSEVQAWQAAAQQAGAPEPQVCTLGRPTVDDAWRPAPSLTVAQPVLPSIDGHDAISWCVATGLPRPGLHDALAQWPLALVLPESLVELRAAAEAGVDRVAHLALVDDGVPLPLDETLLAQAMVRRDVLDATLTALRVGRGRPFTWEEVNASKAVSSAFADRVRALTVSHGRDAKGFLQQTSRLKRFHDKNVEKLREHLIHIGALDERVILEQADVVRQAQSAVARHLHSGRLTLRAVESLVGRCAEVVQVEWPHA